MFKFSQKPAFGLDLSDLSFKVIRLKKKGGHLALASFIKEELPAGLIEEGEIKKEAELVEIFKKALKQIRGEPFREKRVICNLPEEKVFIRTIQLPQMKPEEISHAVRWEIESHIPLSVENVYLDWYLLGPRNSDKGQSSQMDILIAAAPKSLVDGYVSFLKKTGLLPTALEPESVAAARGLIAFNDNRPTIVVDLGATGTNFVICSSSIVRFTSHVRISGQLFNQVIMKSLKVEEKEANALKIKAGLDKTQYKGAVYKALEPIVNDLASQIQVYLNFYHNEADHTQEHDGQISQVLLCGGDALLLGLPQFLSQNLNLPVYLGDPLINILPAEKRKNLKTINLSGKEAMSRRETFSFAIAFGLALREFI